LTTLTDAERDRAAGVLLGLASGDALGAPYEFRTPPSGEAEMKGGGIGPWEPGEWTDDTQMALCIGRVAASGPLDPLAVGAGFLEWHQSEPKDVGIQTRNVLGEASGPEELAQVARAYFELNPDRSAGNGSLMRTAPVALACLGDDAAIVHTAREISSLTHADPRCADACVLWCIAIDRAVREGRLDGVRDGLHYLSPSECDFWEQRLDEAHEQPPASFRPNGWVVTALQAALAAIAQTPVPDPNPALHLQHALHAAVCIGDDTDTVAAIAGALLGARWGASALPAQWRSALHGWPGLDADDLERLALDTVERDRPRRWSERGTGILRGR
jgi:ADP-ribosylglycohydrolase